MLLAGVFQIVLGLLGVAQLMRFIPRSVMVGFVNALAILIFLAQVPRADRRPVAGLPAGRASASPSSSACPGLTRAVPAPLVAIVVLTARSPSWPRSPSPRWATRASCPTACRSLSSRTCRSRLDTLRIIAPYALAMALVGLLESLMTAKLVDDITDTRSHKTREAWGQGVANIVTGFFGGMGGCAMIGQTMINVKASGARTRISTFLAGVFLLVLVVGLGDIVSPHPDGRARGRDDHGLGRHLRLAQHPARHPRRMPRSETAVMARHRGRSSSPPTTWPSASSSACCVAMVLFARRVAHFVTVERTVTEHDGGRATYTRRRRAVLRLRNDLSTQFDYARTPNSVVIDLPASHIWDASTVAALDAITAKYRAARQDRRDRGPEQGQRPDARTPGRQARRGELTGRRDRSGRY